MFDFNDTDLTLHHTAGNETGDETGAEYVDAAITSRRSVRGFTDQPVPHEMLEHLLAVASRAPSGTNMQPWKVYATRGAKKEALTQAILEAKHGDQESIGTRDWKYYPDEFPPVYKARRRKIGWDMYGLAGIKKGEMEKAEQLRDRNFHFFGAPVGLIFSIDEELEVGSWLDYGFFLQNIAVAARARGLHTCAQAIFADVPGPVRRILPIPETEIIVCGMSIGYIDDSVDVNGLETERAPVSEFTQFFED
ncbi:MAG: nitroreductase [Rhodospirillaceae bacterium]|jgi:nitroreductase|nr:nitroreductase [Rhodospirillaceae bacterium]MBT3908328.1 nitroreductase [Rhodospirillaceae bacterium]MBT5297525.1 nitroreductase [Rhodospirillaceae bacterium]MBT5515230.1 nitroreductase [Rhodospirillaceae bacterium]MBT6086516.1 nitroreductase [Rhodospirillaceae bacterium]